MWESVEKYIQVKFKRLLKKPFYLWRSYVDGIIDENGHLLKPLSSLTPTERQYHNVFTELVRKVKMLVLTYVPSGKGLMRYKIYNDWMNDKSILNKVVKECNLNNSENVITEEKQDLLEKIFLDWLHDNNS